MVYANRAAGELLGLDRDELRGRSELPTPCECLSESGETLPDRWPGVDALRTGRSQRPRVMGLPRPDGRVRWVRVSATRHRPIGADFAARRDRPAPRRGRRRHPGLAPGRQRQRDATATDGRRRQGRPLAARASGRRAARQWQHRRRGRRAAWASRPPPSACTSATPRASSVPTRGPRRSPSPWPAAKSQRRKGGVRPYSTWRTDAPTTRPWPSHGPVKTMTGGRRRALVATSALGVSALIASVAHSTLGLGPDGLAWQLLFCVVYLCRRRPVPGPRRVGAGRARHLAVPRRSASCCTAAAGWSTSSPTTAGAHAVAQRPAVARRLPRLLPGRRPARPRALRAPRRGHVARRPARRAGPRSGHRRHGAAGVAVAPRRRRQRRRHRRRLPAGRRRPADLPGHHVRRLELAPEPLGAGARRRAVHPRRRRHDLRDRQPPTAAGSPAAPTTRCGAPGDARARRCRLAARASRARSSAPRDAPSSSRRPSRRSRSACSSTARACA